MLLLLSLLVGWLVGCCCCCCCCYYYYYYYWCCCCWYYCYHTFIFNINYLFLLIHFYYQIHQTAMTLIKSVKNMILLFTTILVNHICHSLQLWSIGSYFYQTLDSTFKKTILRCINFTRVFASLKTFSFDWHNLVLHVLTVNYRTSVNNKV